MDSRMEIEIMESPANDKLESCGSQIKLVNKYNQETIIISDEAFAKCVNMNATPAAADSKQQHDGTMKIVSPNSQSAVTSMKTGHKPNVVLPLNSDTHTQEGFHEGFQVHSSMESSHKEFAKGGEM